MLCQSFRLAPTRNRRPHPGRVPPWGAVTPARPPRHRNSVQPILVILNEVKTAAPSPRSPLRAMNPPVAHAHIVVPSLRVARRLNERPALAISAIHVAAPDRPVAGFLSTAYK